MVRVGAHASVAGGVQNAVSEQVEYNGTCGQIFTTSPQVWKHPDIAATAADEFRSLSAAAGIEPWVIHASYLVNLATPKQELHTRSIASMQSEIDTAQQLDIPYVNVHLGAHTGAGVDSGLDNVLEALDALDIPDEITILLESDAGSGTKLGGKFDHIATVLSESDQPLGVCLDTAHAFAAGYDLSSPYGVEDTLTAFDDVIGRDHLKCIHLNDSKHGCGTNKDEHAHIGEGQIGVEGMRAFLSHEFVRDIPIILETPTEDGKSYPWNIDRVRELSPSG